MPFITGKCFIFLQETLLKRKASTSFVINASRLLWLTASHCPSRRKKDEKLKRQIFQKSALPAQSPRKQAKKARGAEPLAGRGQGRSRCPGRGSALRPPCPRRAFRPRGRSRLRAGAAGGAGSARYRSGNGRAARRGGRGQTRTEGPPGPSAAPVPTAAHRRPAPRSPTAPPGGDRRRPPSSRRSVPAAGAYRRAAAERRQQPGRRGPHARPPRCPWSARPSPSPARRPRRRPRSAIGRLPRGRGSRGTAPGPAAPVRGSRAEPAAADAERASQGREAPIQAAGV
uniref:uncharacterized protein n=1 Tax=Lonchura striata TaxID=40157 RepID=UPI000B4D050D|nr:uncharacterized protein LOC110470257 [Lonchura striata domestica]